MYIDLVPLLITIIYDFSSKFCEGSQVRHKCNYKLVDIIANYFMSINILLEMIPFKYKCINKLEEIVFINIMCIKKLVDIIPFDFKRIN